MMNRRQTLKTGATVALGLSIAGCNTQSEPDSEQISLNAPALGDSDAPQILAFEDLGCGFCARFHQNVFPSFREDYIETGDIQYVFNDYVIPAGQFSSESHQYASGVQDIIGTEAFFQYIEYIFNNQSRINVDSLQSQLSELVDSQDDIDQIIENAENRRYQESIDSGNQLGNQYNIRGTPRFVLNGTVIEDVGTYSAFSAAVDAQL